MNYLQFNDRGKFEPEEQALAEYFGEGNYTGFYKKHFLRDKFAITKDDFISGDIDVMFHAMKRLGIEYSYNDYPEKLKPYLHRKIWEDELGNIKKEIFAEGYLKNPIFIKPKDKLKRFTGFVLETIDDLANCKGAGNQTKVWCSEPITFVDEFRIYRFQYHDSALTTYSVGCHKSNFNFQNLEKVDIFIRSLPWGLDLPVACAIDVGILSNGEVALIEVNDAFSLGLYKTVCPKTEKGSSEYNELYCKCLIERWNELKNVEYFDLSREELQEKNKRLAELESQLSLKIINCIKSHLCKQDEDYDKPVISPKFLSDALDQMMVDGFEGDL